MPYNSESVVCLPIGILHYLDMIVTTPTRGVARVNKVMQPMHTLLVAFESKQNIDKSIYVCMRVYLYFYEYIYIYIYIIYIYMYGMCKLEPADKTAPSQ
jgi:hypothetical protein